MVLKHYHETCAMITQFIVRYKYSLVAVFFIPLFFCTAATEKLSIALNKNDSTPFMEFEQGDSITLCWDSPENGADSIKTYELSYYSTNQPAWKVIKTNIPLSDTPHTVVHRNEVVAADSIFYFGVRAIANNGFKSTLHASSDSTASPTGWFVLWK